jgi:hypothetical protein
MKSKFLSDKTYSAFKFTAQIGLPALGTLYFALAAIWSLPAPEKILGTIIAVDTFIGLLLGISTNAYLKSDAQYHGAIDVNETPEKIAYSLNLNRPPEDIKHLDKVVFKVNTPSQ